MNDKKISQLDPAVALYSSTIFPVTQLVPGAQSYQSFGLSLATLLGGLPAGGGSADSTFVFPNDIMLPVTIADIGKLAMNDGSGAAKVYSLSPATPSQAGKWVIDFSSGWNTNLNGMNVNLNFNSGSLNINESNWRTGVTVSTGDQDIALIRTALTSALASFNTNNSTSYSLSMVLSNNGFTLTLDEVSYQGIQISTNNLPSGTFTVTQLSLPSCPIAPTAFPLGKIVGLQGSDVLISAATVETYTLSGTAVLDQDVFNTADFSTIDFRDHTAVINLTHTIAVPAANGAVAAFDLTPYSVDNSLLYSLRDQFLGIILSVNGSTVTVLHLNGLSPIFNLVIKAIWYFNNH